MVLLCSKKIKIDFVFNYSFSSLIQTEYRIISPFLIDLFLNRKILSFKNFCFEFETGLWNCVSRFESEKSLEKFVKSAYLLDGIDTIYTLQILWLISWILVVYSLVQRGRCIKTSNLNWRWFRIKWIKSQKVWLRT